jgi:GNAT superfamily N-acetyltransferase
MGAPEPVVVELSAGDDALVSEFYRAVLRPSFRDDELVDEDELRETIDAGTCHVLVARDDDGTVLGGAVGDWFESSRVQLLSYLAARPGVRGRGLGTLLVRAAVDSWVTRLDPLLVVGEVEDPRHYSNDDPDSPYGDVIARVRFYEKLGVRALPIPYTQPALRTGASRVPHLLLMVFAVGAGAAIEPGRVEGAIVEQFLVEYFTDMEGDVSDDVELSRLLAACREPSGLPLLLADELP